jgi:hypothetical protein
MNIALPEGAPVRSHGYDFSSLIFSSLIFGGNGSDFGSNGSDLAETAATRPQHGDYGGGYAG